MAGSDENNKQFHKLLEIKLYYYMRLIEKSQILHFLVGKSNDMFSPCECCDRSEC